MAPPATPNGNTYLSTINHLRIPDGAATGEQLNLFLSLLQRAAAQYKVETPAAKQLVLFGKEVAYMNASHRGNIIAQSHNALGNDIEEDGEDEEEEEDNEAFRA